jgi:hypothetical protein
MDQTFCDLARFIDGAVLQRGMLDPTAWMELDLNHS